MAEASRTDSLSVILLAGGGGVRLWPLSRQDFPKQFLHFGDNESLLQKTVLRLLYTPVIREIIIATNEHYEHLVRSQMKTIPGGEKIEILVEPFCRNTAPAIALSIKHLEEIKALTQKSLVLVLPSDHLIEPQSVFSQALATVLPAIQRGEIITFGIPPTKPETGYGYLKLGASYDLFTQRVEKFIEKPDSNRAKELICMPDIYWNSGMFAFSIGTFWEELKKHAPSIYELCQGSYCETQAKFQDMPNISIDYAVMEKSSRIVGCPLSVSWSDVGSWDSVYDVLEKDENRNVKRGNIFDIDTRNSLILGGKKLISTLGLEDMLIVETDDAIFIGKKGESQRVKNLVQRLIDRGSCEGTRHPYKELLWGKINLLSQGNQYSVRLIEVFAHNGGSYDVSDRLAGLFGLEGNIEIEMDSNFVALHPFEYLSLGKNRDIKWRNLSERQAKFLLICQSSL